MQVLVKCLGNHSWQDSHRFLIGPLYTRIYKYVCKCGAFYKWDGSVIEPSHSHFVSNNKA